MKTARITLLNGSVGGENGNSAVLARALEGLLGQHGIQTQTLHLNARPDRETIRTCLRESSGFVFLTGTYWDSWGSPLQIFFEENTDLEASETWLGKAAAVIVTMHAVGGKGVASRLQGILNTLGLYVPPMSAMVYSLANHLALQNTQRDFAADFWCLQDLEIVAHNLATAVCGRRDYKTWSIDMGDAKRTWLLLP